MFGYKFVGIRENKNNIFYIDGINISGKTWFSTGKCITVQDEKSKEYFIISEYYLKISEKQKLYFAAGYTNEHKEAIYARFNNGVN